MATLASPAPDSLRGVPASVAIVVPFLNEERHLPRFLASLAAQTRSPDAVLLVDDGSTDRSPEIAAAFARNAPYARLLSRPPRPPERDRLLRAAEYQAFNWAAAQLGPGHEIVAKLDADLELTPALVAELCDRFGDDPGLGIAGAFLSVVAEDGTLAREHCPPYHVRGAVKFYRRRCLEQISPVEAILGWDGIDEHKARMLGWRTRSFAVAGGDPVHLRPNGAHGGRLRHQRRLGMCDWAIGYHPAWVALRACRASRQRPFGVAPLAYLAGFVEAALRRTPRAEPVVRAHVRREQLGRIRRRVAT
jgi:poly-beta-1,6-N-acetyl-D-glucosamine synthase